MTDAEASELLAEALDAFHPPRRHDPDDITTWTAAALDELAVLAVAGRPGFTIEYLDAGQPDAPHGVNTVGEMR